MITELKKQALAHDITALPDHIVGRAEYLKDYFDRNVYEVLNDVVHPLIDALTASGGASEIGAEAFSVVPAGSVQSQLEALKELMDGMQWGIPDSLGTEIIKDGAVTEEKLSEQVNERLEEAFYSAVCQTVSNTVKLTAELPQSTCTVRFTADTAYVKGNTLTVNGESYTLMLPNGKALPDNAWIAGAVVCLQLNPETKTAFFNGGGADLSFVTAGAEQILSGYIGANAEGEPVPGTAKSAPITTITGITDAVSITSSESSKTVVVPLTNGKPTAIAYCANRIETAATPSAAILRNHNGNSYYFKGFWVDGLLDGTVYSNSIEFSNGYKSMSIAVDDTQIVFKYKWSTYASANSLRIYYELYY